MAVVAAQGPVMNVPRMGRSPSPEFIRNLEAQLIDRYRPRNADFEVLVNAWHGIYYQNADMRRDIDAIGRPQLRVSDMHTQDVPMTLNIVKSFADAYKRMLVGLPDPRVPRPPGRFPPTLEGQHDAEVYQARMKRVCLGIWEASQMDIQQVASAFYLAVCGSVGLIVIPDFDKGHAVIRAVAPYDIYGVGKMGDDYGLSRCVVTVDEDHLRVQGEFGDLAGGAFSERDVLTAASSAERSVTKDRTVRHSIYLDEEWFVRMIGGEEVGRVHHGLGFCPALVCPLILLPQFVNRGHSAIEQLLPMQLSINAAITLWEEGLKDSILPTTWVRNAQSVPQNWARGRGQLITIGEGGDIGELGGRSAEAMRTIVQHVDLMQRLMELNSGVSRPAVSGQLAGGGPTSGRGIEKAQSAYLAGIEEAQTTQGYYMSRALKYALDMTAAIGPENEIWDEEKATVVFSGSYGIGKERGKEFEESFGRSELKGVPTPKMSYSPLAHMGMGERLSMVLQGLGSEPPLISWNEAVDLVGWGQDNQNMRSEIESDLAWRLQILQRRVQVEQGAQPTPDERPGADPMKAAAAADAGATNPETMAANNLGGAGTPVVPGGGAPVMPPSEALASTVAPTTLPSGVMGGLAGGPPALPPAPQTPMRTTMDLVGQLREELAGIPLSGPVVIFGDTLYVEYKDKNRIARRIGHHDLNIVVKGKRGQNVPASATVVIGPQTGRGGGQSATDQQG